MIKVAEEEFWNNYSKIEKWVDQNYDTSLFEGFSAFPLLEKVHNVGVPIASKIFKEEIISRFAYNSIVL